MGRCYTGKKIKTKFSPQTILKYLNRPKNMYLIF